MVNIKQFSSLCSQKKCCFGVGQKLPYSFVWAKVTPFLHFFIEICDLCLQGRCKQKVSSLGFVIDKLATTRRDNFVKKKPISSGYGTNNFSENIFFRFFIPKNKKNPAGQGVEFKSQIYTPSESRI